MRKILVTGSEGFIGSHVVEELIKQNYKVKAFIFYNFKNSLGWLEENKKKFGKNIEYHFGDVRNYSTVINAMSNCDAVIHLAALIGIPFSYKSPDSYIDTNINGALNILTAAKNLKLSKVIITSTSEIYGSAQYIPIDEKHPINCQSPYAASKSAADLLSLSFYNSFGTPVTIIRPFNTYGPRQSARALIPTIITQILNKQKKIKLGNIYPTRDFNFVNDVAKSFVKSLTSKNSNGRIINIGSNHEISVENLVYKISKLVGTKIKIISDNNRIRPKKSEVDRLFSDNRLAKEILNWEPSVKGERGLTQGLKKTISWFKKKENLILYKPDIYNI